MTTASTLTRTQIYLHTEQQSALADLAKTMRQSSSALIRQAIDVFLAERQPETIKARRMAALKGSTYNPDFDLAALRREERKF